MGIEIAPGVFVDRDDLRYAGIDIRPPASLEEALDAVERPEDCDAPCWRNQPDGGPCSCDDETEGGVWQPGC